MVLMAKIRYYSLPYFGNKEKLLLNMKRLKMA